MTILLPGDVAPVGAYTRDCPRCGAPPGETCWKPLRGVDPLATHTVSDTALPKPHPERNRPARRKTSRR